MHDVIADLFRSPALSVQEDATQPLKGLASAFCLQRKRSRSSRLRCAKLGPSSQTLSSRVTDKEKATKNESLVGTNVHACFWTGMPIKASSDLTVFTCFYVLYYVCNFIVVK